MRSFLIHTEDNQMKKIDVLFLLLLTAYIGPGYCQWSVVSYSPSNYLEGVKFFNENTGFVAGSGGVWKTTTGGTNWTQVLMTGHYLSAFHFVDSLNGYAGGDSVIFKTTNGGINWSQHVVQAGTYPPAWGISFFNINTGIAVSGGPVFNRTTNAGGSWYALSGTSAYYAYGCHSLNNGFGYVVGFSTSGPESVWKTTNFGANWQRTYLGGLVNLYAVWAVTSDLVFACGSSGRIRRTTNGGANWVILDSLTSRSLNSITFADANTGTVVGNYGVILRTTNSGNNWAIQSSGTTHHLEAVSFINANTGWAVGEQGIVLKTTNGGVTPVEQMPGRVPKYFVLHQNYPNPFNAATKIKFEIPRASLINMSVYDLTGKQIAILVNQELREGVYEIRWNAENLPSGVYFYKFDVGEVSLARKLILLK